MKNSSRSYGTAFRTVNGGALFLEERSGYSTGSAPVQVFSAKWYSQCQQYLPQLNSVVNDRSIKDFSSGGHYQIISGHQN